MPGKATHELDATGLKCPLPVLRASQRLAALAPGDRLVVTATDPATLPDMLAWARTDLRVSVESQERRAAADGGELLVHVLVRCT